MSPQFLQDDFESLCDETQVICLYKPQRFHSIRGICSGIRKTCFTSPLQGNVNHSTAFIINHKKKKKSYNFMNYYSYALRVLLLKLQIQHSL